MVFSFETNFVEMTESFGKGLGELLSAGMVVALDGDLGAGKTALTRGIAVGMKLSDQAVMSPTFTIVNEYPATSEDGISLYHFDTYRLNDEDDFYNSGLDEYFYYGGVCVIEWSSVISNALPAETIYIRIEGTGDVRHFEVSVSEQVFAKEFLEALKELTSHFLNNKIGGNGIC